MNDSCDLEYLFNILCRMDANNLKKFVETKEEFDKTYKNYVRKYDPIKLKNPKDRAYPERLLDIINRHELEKLNDTE